jgi:uncharacterized membrane protein YvbJ
MEKENKDIETLLERFFEGQTSNEEERRLYLFFRREKLPDELAQYKEIVTYFESGLADELDAPKNVKMLKEVRKKRWLVWGSIAASFLILLSSTFFIFRNTDPYEGSYIVRNGVRITDLNLIRPELEAAIQKSLLIEQEADRLIELLSETDDSQEDQIMQQLQDYNQQILDNTQDENTRNEIEKLLNSNL